MNRPEIERKEFLEIVGKHSQHWAYTKAETLEKLHKWVERQVIEAYKKGHIDGSIEVVNNTCEICHAYPMTANCNNAGCDV